MRHVDGLAPTAASRRVATLSLAALLFAAFFGLRLLVDDPDEPVLFLLALPIALVGFELGIVAGTAAGVLGLALFAAWGALDGESLGGFDYSVRAITFVVVGAGIGLMSDRRRSAIEALRRSNESLRHANRDLEQFAYMAAHDLQAPLSVVSGFATLLRDRYGERLDDSGREFLGYVGEGVADMRELIDGMLEIARGGAAGLELREVDAGGLVAEVVAGFAGELEGRDARVEVGPLPAVRADPQRLRQVFANLLSNALKFSDDPAEIAVRAHRDGHGWAFEVQDNGLGVPPEHAERIFEPLHRLETERRGAGIGLAVCRRIVESHGGAIHVRPAEGAGSVFAFTLPDDPPVP